MKTHKSYRLSDATDTQIRQLAKQWRCSQAQAIERSIRQASGSAKEHLEAVTREALSDALRRIVRNGV